MVNLVDVERFLETSLNTASIRGKDAAVNGVQIRGKPQVTRIVTGVSASLALFERAIELKADLILVHHGMFWAKDSRVVEGSLKRRLKLLLDHDITLMGYHLPLDCHPVWGNNAQIRYRLALKDGEPFGLYRGLYLSAMGLLKRPVGSDLFLKRISDLFGGTPLVLPYGPGEIQRVALCSGAAPDLVREAKASGADLYLTGEITEYVTHYAREEEIHVVAAGHHRTEKFGVQALGEALSNALNVEHVFVDIYNPL